MIGGILLALLTSVSWAFGNVFIQKSGRAMGSARAMFWALLLGGALSGVASLLFDQRAAPFSSAALFWILLAGASGLVAYLCLFYAFEHAPLSIAVPIVSSWSLFTAAFSLTVLGETLRLPQAVGAAAVVSGVLLVSVGASRQPKLPERDHQERGDASHPPTSPKASSALRATLAGLASAVGFGIMVPALARVAPATGEFAATTLVYAVGLVMGVPFAIAHRIDLRPPARSLWRLILFTGAFETAGFVAMAFARRFAPMALVAPVASLAAALTLLYAWVILRERPGVLTGLGAALACGGVVVLSF